MDFAVTVLVGACGIKLLRS